MYAKRTCLLAALAAGCGAEVTEAPAPDVDVVRVAASAGAWTSEGALDTEVRPDAVGVGGDGAVVAVSGGVTYALVRGALVKKPMYADVGDTPSLGVVSGIAARLPSGAWLASDRGLFSVDRHFVTRAPLSEAVGAVHDVSEAAGGPLSGLWLASADGLLRRRGEALDRVEIPGLDAPTRLTVSADGQRALVATEDRVALLRAADGALVSRDLGDFGAIHALARGPDAVWAATEQGVLRVDPSGPTHFTLGPSPVESTEIAIDASTRVAWVRIDGALVSILGRTLTRYPVGTLEAGLAVDRLGDVYSVAEGAIVHRGTGAEGAAVTFEDVQPWIQSHCSACHMNQTANFEDYEVFVERAEDALTRVRSGDMPRCEGSLRCPDDRALLPSDYAVLEQWIRDGMPE